MTLSPRAELYYCRECGKPQPPARDDQGQRTVRLPKPGSDEEVCFALECSHWVPSSKRVWRGGEPKLRRLDPRRLLRDSDQST